MIRGEETTAFLCFVVEYDGLGMNERFTYEHFVDTVRVPRNS